MSFMFSLSYGEMVDCPWRAIMEKLREQVNPSGLVAFFAEGRLMNGAELPMDGILLCPKEAGGPFPSGEGKRCGIFRDGDDAGQMDDDAAVLEFFDLVDDAVHAGSALNGLKALDISFFGGIAAAERDAVREGKLKIAQVHEIGGGVPLSFVQIAEEFFCGGLHGAFMSESRVFASC